ncbi:MAG: type I methionyl aminopeptidase [Oscillospiraceae bacterium]|nr:type I methionyl aminopeptidase [Oscillospiraceae bacterium]
MIILKTAKELAIMRESGIITANAIKTAEKYCKPGYTTKQIAAKIEEYLTSKGAVPSFLGYRGFTGVACISVNDEVIHGIPGARRLNEGDIVSVDIGSMYKGYHTDSSYTFKVGTVDPKIEKLLKTTKKCLHEAIAKSKIGNRVGDISHTVQTIAEKSGFGVVRDYVGHGIGKNLHESPDIPNFGAAGRGARLMAGMTMAIEPMINAGSEKVFRENDGWTIKTMDGSVSAHFEHTVAITHDGPVILTSLE